MFVLAATFVNLQHAQLTAVLTVIYILDVIHLAMMLLKLNKIYLDPVSGRLVKDPYVIRKKYASTTFWLDFLTLIPFDIMSKSFTDNVFVHNLCRLNRSGKFIALVIYYYQCEERLTMKKHLKWTYMIYSNLFLIQLFACGWLLVACPNSKCHYNSERISMTDFKVVRENDTFSSVLLAYLFIVNMYTGASSIKSYPIVVTEIIVACIIALIAQYITTNLCSAYTSMVLVDQFNFSRYEVRYNRLSTYLQARNLSPKLYTKVSNYCFRLWHWQRGDWLPEMIQECPNSLKQNIMQLLYGKNLSNHFLFSTTHKDFLRQLIAHLERFVFTPGESIVETGDSDCCMYFINKGEVDVLEFEGKAEKKIVQLTPGMSFGEVQGLFCISHQYSYRAGTVCEILVLKKSKWEYLLKWFPASREEINAKARLHNVVREDDVLDESG
ncbi:cNMP binding protein, partial [Oryctes borbonicus]